MSGAHLIQEFIAHGANVTCLALGHKSGHVLVTGGDDKKVNLWAVGKPTCILSLSGHGTPIQCVRFGHTENTVCAGSIAGALKVWDLEALRLMRTLTGHKSSVRCVEFHPYGDFLTSGSKDTSIKLWDIRRKGCIFTYKGHTEAVNSLKFSPDGQWIASAGQEGIVKLWDLRMGRMLKEFSEHAGPVHTVEFHPHEFLLASSSQDHTINFWDLEHFNLVSSTGRESSPSRCLLFSNTGEVLFSGAADMLRVYGWEPSRTITSKSVPWGKVRDMAISLENDRLVAVSYRSTNVAIWTIETSELSGSGCISPEVADEPLGIPFTPSNSLRKSFSKQKPSPEAKKALRVKTIEESERSETDPEDDVQPEIHNVTDYQAVFRPSRSLNRSPTISIYESPRPERVASSASLYKSSLPSSTFNDENHLSEKVDEEKLDNDEDNPANRTFTISDENVSFEMHSSPLSQESHGNGDSMSLQPSTSTPVLYAPDMSNVLMDRRQSLQPVALTSPAMSGLHPPTPSTLPPSPVTLRYSAQRRHSVTRDTGASAYQSSAHQSSVLSDNEFPVKLSSIHHSSSESNVPRAASVQGQRHSSRLSRPLPQRGTLAKPMLREPKSDRSGLAMSPSISPTRTPEEEFIPASMHRPSGLDFEDFLPKSYHQRLPFSQTMPNMSEAEVLSSMMRGHESILAILDTRQRTLEYIHTLWQSKGLKHAVEAAINEDLPVVADFLDTISLRHDIWNLDICVLVLPAILQLLTSKYETHMRRGCDALRLILRNFSSVIKTNMHSGSGGGFGVDIPREERYRKCKTCYDHLVSIRAYILKRQTLQGPLGQSFRELQVALQELDE